MGNKSDSRLKPLTFAVMFAALGLLLGYGIFGRVDGRYIDPARFIESRPHGPAGIFHTVSNRIEGIDEKRQRILVTSAVGGVVGLFLGVLTRRS